MPELQSVLSRLIYCVFCLEVKAAADSSLTSPAAKPPSPPSAGERWKGTEETQGIAMSGIAEHEIGDHNSAEDCWVVITRQVYDITTFVDEHPGGKDILLEYAGKDATEAFEVRNPFFFLEYFSL